MNRTAEPGWLAVLALAAVTATAVFATTRLVPVVRAALDSHRGFDNADEPALDRFGETLALYAARVDGRSPFFDPPKPVPPPPPPRPPAGPTEPTAPPPPARYGGPDIIGMVGDQVWFATDLRIRLGDDETEDLRVTGINAPWSAEIQWKGVTFTVPFLERDELLARRQAAEQQTESTPESVNAADPERSQAIQKPDEPGTELE